MATRKVLINYHTSGSSAPAAASVYHGELVVAHENGKETIFTKNNAGDMVPFISCAQTKTMIDNAITAANVTYDVEKGENETHLAVQTGGTNEAVKYIITSNDVQSEEEFKSYSAATKTRIDTNVSAITDMAGVVSALTNMVVTAISGDSIIVAELEENGTNANKYNLTHKTATAVTGFNKLDTDDYGHVTAATPVATADIQALGFKTSAETGEDLNALSASVVTNKTNIENLSAGTQHDIEALSGDVINYVKVVSGDIETAIVALSANTEAAITAAIEGLDSESAVTAAGKYMTGIAIADGKISGITEADLPTLSVTSAGTGNVVSQITVNGHEITYQTASVATSEGIAELSAATISLSGVVEDNERVIAAAFNDVNGRIDTVSGNVNTNATNISNLSGAVVTNVENIDDLSAATLDLSAVTLTGVSLNNTPLTVSDHVVSVPVTTSGSGIANAANTGSVADAKAVKEYVEDTLSSAVEYKGATGATPSSPAKGDLYIASSDFVVEGSKSAETGDFIIYDGTKWDVIEKNLDGAITGNLTQNTVTLGNSTNSVVSLAAGTDGQVLTQGTNGPEWANLPELASAVTGTGNVVTDIAVNDHTITFTKGLEAASSGDVAALSAGTIQLSGDVVTYVNALSASAHNSMIARDDAVFSSAVTYVDDQIDEVYASAVSYTDLVIDGLDSTGAVATTGNYLTSVTITDGKITAVGEETLPAAVVITATTATPVDTASAVLTGVTASGADHHELTFGMSNKIFSAETSDSAITSVSAQTSVSALTSESALTAVHADAAAKVDSALTINIIDSAGTTSTTVFDGSANQTINLTNTDTATTEAGHYAPATAASAFTAPAGSFLSAVSVDSKNHVLEVAYADKINSAFTSESAITTVSAAVATNAAHASAATKVDSALTLTDVAATNSVVFDGSANQTVTFGTATSISGENSMTMSDTGVVDVNIIDCGSY